MSNHEGASTDPTFETAREREVYRYFQPSSQRFAPEHTPQSSVDTALSAFAQLATLRLDARRALISLIDRKSQHILAEATQSLSLQSESVHNEHDELWFGATTLPRELGLCETALDILPPAQSGPQLWHLSPLIVNDLTLDERFKNRPFVTSRPSLRFFAAMPIRTKSGFNIGTLSVYDDRPRQGLDDVKIKFLDDVCITIMSHLEMTRVKAAHRRSEKMVSGLGVFVEGRSSLRDWWLDTKNNKAWGPYDSRDGAEAPSHVPGKESFENPLIVASPSDRPASTRDRFKPQDSNLTRSSPIRAAADAHPVQSSQRLSHSPLVRPVRTNSDTSSTRQDRLHTPFPAFIEVTTPTQADPDPVGSHLPSVPNQKPGTFATDLQESMLPANLKDMFSRASNIIRECIEVDGTVFLDASVGTFGGHVVESHRRIGESNGTGESEESVVSIGEGLSISEIKEIVVDGNDQSQGSSTVSIDERQKKCGILGFSTATKSSLTGDHAPESYVPVSETFLQGLLHKYPRGQVFDLTEGGELVPNIKLSVQSEGESAEDEPEKISLTRKERTNQAEAKAIVEMLPGVRSVVFSPLWDSHRERWFAGGFAWTTLSTRVLTRTEDVNYLAAFGNSIMADVARLDAVAADQAKSDFISSISHELRSPLHGILASVEFLQETTVDLFQNSMIDTIERCGRTLLDTIQHVLDFAKINNFVKPKRRLDKTAGGKSESREMGLSTDIDLSVITEEVVDAMYAGYEFERTSSLAMASGFPSDEGPKGGGMDESGMALNLSDVKKERVEIIMDIAWRANWVFHTQSGALRRVLMNLFCNSLKYTDTGWVKVSLQAEDIVSALNQPQKSKVTITISDSGRGISEEFLHGNLFTPFMQSDPMNPGTGLGLSIVLQIVRSLGGTIDVKSKLGVGTEIKVTLALTQTPHTSGVQPSYGNDANYGNPAQRVRRKTSGLTLGLVGFDGNRTSKRFTILDAKTDHSPSLQSSLERVTMLWFDLKVTPPSEWKNCPPDIYIANETPDVCGALGGKPIIVLCSNASTYRAYMEREKQIPTKDSGLVHFVSKPCGPCKLAKAFTFCLGNASKSPLMPAKDTLEVPFSDASPALSTPLGTLDSPQSLFSLSPRSPTSGEETLPYEYFPTRPGLPPRSHSFKPTNSLNSLAAGPKKLDKVKPVLLLVEDNEINMRLLETFIRKNKFEYDTAMNGLLAVQAFQNNPRKYDIVFMDISMPVMNGMEASLKIRALEQERHQKPAMIIALTGLASAEAQQEAMSSGMTLFLTKPVRFGELRKILGEWIP